MILGGGGAPPPTAPPRRPHPPKSSYNLSIFTTINNKQSFFCGKGPFLYFSVIDSFWIFPYRFLFQSPNKPIGVFVTLVRFFYGVRTQSLIPCNSLLTEETVVVVHWP